MFPFPSRDFGSVNDLGGDATHSGAMHAETAFCDTVFKFVEESDLAVVVVDVDLHSFGRDLRVPSELGSEGVVVGCEEAGAANVRCDVVEDGLCNGDAIVGTCSAPKFVEDDEGARGSFGKYLFGLGELDEEGTLSCEDVVVGSETGHYAVNWSQGG